MTTSLKNEPRTAEPRSNWRPPRSDVPFYAGLGVLSGSYVLLIVAMLGADIFYAAGGWERAIGVFFEPDIRYATWLTLISCSITTILALWVAVPIGYLLSRFEFRGKVLADTILDIPIFLPPLVIGLSLLILFCQTPLRHIDKAVGISLHVPAVILAQFAVAAAFAVRTMRVTFDDISPRCEHVALTLGCSRSQAFWNVVFPEARHGMLTAGTLAWARSLGEFGPLLVFAGTVRQRTEVLSTSVYMEISTGNLEGAVGISLLMIVVALIVLVVVRILGGSAPRMGGFHV